MKMSLYTRVLRNFIPLTSPRSIHQQVCLKATGLLGKALGQIRELFNLAFTVPFSCVLEKKDFYKRIF